VNVTETVGVAQAAPSTPGRAAIGCRLRRFGIDTGNERVVFLRVDSPVCQSEGFTPRARIQIHIDGRSLVAMLDVVHGDLLAQDEAGLSEAAWCILAPEPDDRVTFTHAPSVESLALIRRKIHGHELDESQFDTIVTDAADHRYSSAELAAFVAACGGNRLSEREVISLTRAMVNGGSRVRWDRDVVVDKHCIGGLPGNRTTPIVVSILAALGMLMPKTSSRAITSPAGTADTMEMLAPVELDVLAMRRVVERTGACIVWGRSANFSPADDVLCRIERMLDVESEGQLVASVLSKKVAAGASHVIIDIPVGPTAKVRSASEAGALAALLREVASAFHLHVRTLFTEGLSPVGRGAGKVTDALDSGAAWRKFVAICEAQGGMRVPGKAAYRQPVEAISSGVVTAMDNRRLAKVAKLAGAPSAPLAGIEVEVRPGRSVARHEPLFTVHAQTKGQLEYALAYVSAHPDMIEVRQP